MFYNNINMKIMVFDTETTGLPKTNIISPDTLDQWPSIVQFSYILFDLSYNEIVRTKDNIIKVPKDILIPEESSKIHGITNQISSKKGIPIARVLKEFFYYAREVDLIVGHNIQFDINMVKVELLRLIYNKSVSERELKNCKYNLHYLSHQANTYCTVKEGVNICSIKAVDKFGKEYFKYPKLVELHQKLFNTIPNHLHNSLNDILVTLRCFVKLTLGSDLNETSNAFKQTVTKLNIYSTA